jgi:hypothetical protein
MTTQTMKYIKCTNIVKKTPHPPLLASFLSVGQAAGVLHSKKNTQLSKSEMNTGSPYT